MTVASLKQGQLFQIKVGTNVLQAQSLGNGKALVTLPDGVKVTFQPPANGVGKALVTVNSDQQTINAIRSTTKLQCTDIEGNPMRLSSLQKGDRFQIKIAGELLDAVFLGKGKAGGTLPSGNQITVQFAKLLTA